MSPGAAELLETLQALLHRSISVQDRQRIRLSASAVIAIFGPALLLIGYLMDRRYYLRLLYGINTYVHRLEDAATEIS